MTVVEQTHMADGEHRVHTTDRAARAIIRDALRRRVNELQNAAGDFRRVSHSEAAFKALLDEASAVGEVLDAWDDK